jgi:hypothetical protein
MGRLKTLRKMSCRIAVVLLVLVIGVAQVSMGLANPRPSCVSGAVSSSVPSASAQAHPCCCGETGSCCCEVRQEATAPVPDMALPAVAGERHNPAPLYALQDVGVQTLSSSQVHQLAGRRTGAGPPLTCSYLVNLTFRC